MKITREIASLDWASFGLKTGVCFCQNCGLIDSVGNGYNICPKCGLLNQYIKGETNGERY